MHKSECRWSEFSDFPQQKESEYTSAYSNEVSTADSAEDFINGRVGWQSAVEDVEVTFQPLWNVIATATRMDHGAHHLYVYDVRKFAGLLEIVKTARLHHLSRYFIRHLAE